MGAGEDTLMPYLNARLLGRLWDGNQGKLINALEDGSFSVPSGQSELEGSQNLFWLKAGAERMFRPSWNARANTDQQLIARLERERDVIGLWGSEQTSHIYHHFILTGMAATWANTDNQKLRNLIEDSVASFFSHCVSFGLSTSPHGLIGQRSTGFNFSTEGQPYIHFALAYLEAGLPDNPSTIGGWRQMLKDSGWVMSMLPGHARLGMWFSVRMTMLYNKQNPDTIWPLAIPVHLFKDDQGLLGHYMERGTNGNTPEIGGFLRHGLKYLPVNSYNHVRQRASHGQYSHEVGDGTLRFKYTGIYTGLPGSTGDPQVISSPISVKLYHRVVGKGIPHNDWRVIWPQESGPIDPPAPPSSGGPSRPPEKPRKSWIERMGL